jgi:hypothetical protein
MLEVITTKLIPLVVAGMIALTPIHFTSKIQKDNNATITDKSNDNSTTINDKTNQQTTKIVTTREGFKGVVLDGKVFEVPYKHITTVEKTYHEKGNEQEKQERSNDKKQEEKSVVTEDVPNIKTTIISKVVDGGQWVVNKIWRTVRP